MSPSMAEMFEELDGVLMVGAGPVGLMGANIFAKMGGKPSLNPHCL